VIRQLGQALPGTSATLSSPTPTSGLITCTSARPRRNALLVISRTAVGKPPSYGRWRRQFLAEHSCSSHGRNDAQAFTHLGCFSGASGKQPWHDARWPERSAGRTTSTSTSPKSDDGCVATPMTARSTDHPHSACSRPRRTPTRSPTPTALARWAPHRPAVHHVAHNDDTAGGVVGGPHARRPATSPAGVTGRGTLMLRVVKESPK